MLPDHFECVPVSEARLDHQHAAAAILVLEDGRYLMQLRDQKPGIFFPGYWGLFGGACDPGETPEQALRRELREEIGIAVGAVSYFTTFSFDFTHHGSTTIARYFFEVNLSCEEHRAVRLGEGAGIEAFTGEELIGRARVTPYDAFAVWMHATRPR